MPPFYKVVMPKTVTVTFYPDAHPEVTSVDGSVQRNAVSEVWDDIRNGAGITARESVATAEAWILSDFGAGKWDTISRILLLFPTFTLPNGAEIVEAEVQAYVVSKGDGLNCNPTFNIFASTPASNTALVPADYSQLGNTPLATAIPYAAVTTLAYNIWTLNPAGITAINKAGITKLGIREARYDALDTPPGWLWNKSCHMYIATSEHLSGNKPKLVVTYKI